MKINESEWFCVLYKKEDELRVRFLFDMVKAVSPYALQSV